LVVVFVVLVYFLTRFSSSSIFSVSGPTSIVEGTPDVSEIVSTFWAEVEAKVTPTVTFTPVLVPEVHSTSVYPPLVAATAAMHVDQPIRLQDVHYCKDMGTQSYDELITVRLSYYWTPYGGINGAGDYDRFADGEYVTGNSIGTTIACPSEIPLGSRIGIPSMGNICWYVCRDRGGAIINDAGIYWIDIFYPALPYDLYYGQVLDGYIKFP
jgi:3D (Asp-Asp-Asp) domain-containing protein